MRIWKGPPFSGRMSTKEDMSPGDAFLVSRANPSVVFNLPKMKTVALSKQSIKAHSEEI